MKYAVVASNSGSHNLLDDREEGLHIISSYVDMKDSNGVVVLSGPSTMAAAPAEQESCRTDEEGGANVHVNTEPTLPNSNTTTRTERLMAYVSTPDFREILSCGIFLVLCVVIYWIDPAPCQRPIPYQYLEGGGDYVRNLVNNEEYSGQDTVSSEWLLILGEILPLLLQVLLSKTMFGRPGDTHKSVCVYCVALGLTLFVTECIKLYVGYLRPIFYDICQPDDDYQECTASSNEVRKSFVSGHASTAFCGLTVLSVYLYNRFGIASIREYRFVVLDGDSAAAPVMVTRYRSNITTKFSPTVHRFLSILSLAPLALATFIAASRVVDNKHFPADVVGGAVLGTSLALFANGIWFDA